MEIAKCAWCGKEPSTKMGVQCITPGCPNEQTMLLTHFPTEHWNALQARIIARRHDDYESGAIMAGKKMAAGLVADGGKAWAHFVPNRCGIADEFEAYIKEAP